MSLMARAGLLGAISGAAGTYNQIQAEQRKKDTEFESQDRQASLEEKRAARLREFNLELQKQRDEAANERNQATIAANAQASRAKLEADKNRPITTSAGQDVITPDGKVIYSNDDKPANSSRSGKGSLVVMKNGERKTEDDIRKMYAQQFVSKGLDGFEKKDPNAPDYMQWRNDLVKDDYRLDSSIVLDADMSTPPTEGEIALAKSRLNDQASWYIPFDNDSNDDDAVMTEVYKMRQEKQQQKHGLMGRAGQSAPVVADPLGIRQ